MNAPEHAAGPNRFRWLGALIGLVAALVVFGPPLPAAAQDGPNLPDLQLQRFRPAPGPTDYLHVYGTGVAPHLEWDVGFYIDHANDPMQVATRNFPFKETVDFQTTVSLLGNIGLFDMFEVGLLLPVTAIQTSQELQPITESGESTTDLPIAGVNDWRITAKYQILDLLEDPLGLAVIAAAYVPLASNEALTSDDAFSGEMLVAGDYWLWRGIRMGLNLGYRYRNTKEVIRNSTISDAFLWGLGLNIPLFIGDLDGIIEIDGEISTAKDPGIKRLTKGEVPSEIKFAVRYQMTEDWTLTAGLGSGLSDGIGAPDFRAILGITGHWVSGGDWSFDYDADGFYGRIDECPDEEEDVDGFQDDDGCPDYDNDGDGVPDDVDECPGTPEGARVMIDGCVDNDFDGDGIPNSEDECPEDLEDKDGFEDKDGCPDLDNDDDGIPDTSDECPDEPENFNGFADEDGCPEDPNDKVTITNDKLVITEQVYFETAKAKIRKESHDILNEVATVLKDNPQIELLRVEGHTDNRGSESYNQDLSQRRAESVRLYLIKQGVSDERLAAVGYGEAEPIADNETEEGRSKNRRVDFTILKTTSDPGE
jgi:outer membrane protein OmpA-like peptidoglycan-associated protein